MSFLNGLADFALQPLIFFVFQSAFNWCTYCFIFDSRMARIIWGRGGLTHQKLNEDSHRFSGSFIGSKYPKTLVRLASDASYTHFRTYYWRLHRCFANGVMKKFWLPQAIIRSVCIMKSIFRKPFSPLSGAWESKLLKKSNGKLLNKE